MLPPASGVKAAIGGEVGGVGVCFLGTLFELGGWKVVRICSVNGYPSVSGPNAVKWLEL